MSRLHFQRNDHEQIAPGIILPRREEILLQNVAVLSQLADHLRHLVHLHLCKSCLFIVVVIIIYVILIIIWTFLNPPIIFVILSISTCRLLFKLCVYHCLNQHRRPHRLLPHHHQLISYFLKDASLLSITWSSACSLFLASSISLNWFLSSFNLRASPLYLSRSPTTQHTLWWRLWEQWWWFDPDDDEGIVRWWKCSWLEWPQQGRWWWSQQAIRMMIITRTNLGQLEQQLLFLLTRGEQLPEKRFLNSSLPSD